MNITPEMRAEITSALIKHRAPGKVSRVTGYDLRLILPIADELAERPREAREEVNGGYGRPELRAFLVGRKLANQTWDNECPTIATARADYEAGTHEMTTGRDGDWLLLYSIPRVRVTPRPDYFKPEF